MMRRQITLPLLSATLFALGSVASAQPSALAPREIKVERVKPAKETRKTLRFLRENLDFLRGQLDYLAERPASEKSAAPFDSSALDLRSLLAEARTARDELHDSDDAASRMDLEALLAAEHELSRLEATMDAQERRLSELEELYLDAPATALLVVGKGLDSKTSALRLLDDDGDEASISADASAAGGLAELYYERIEPRAQTWTVNLPGEGPIYLSFAPRVGETSVLELDLTAHEDGLPLLARLWSFE